MVLPTATLVLAAAALCTSTVIKSPDAGAIPPNFELLILHNNDMHARFEQTSQLSGACTTADREAGKCYGGFPRVAYVVKEARKKAATGEGPPVLYLNAGDTYTGTAWFTIYKWKIAAEFINALRPDAVSLGNHELDNGVPGLAPFIANLTCPVLAANLILSKEPSLQAELNLMKSVIFNVNGTKVGVIGYLTPDTKVLADKNDVEYVEETIAIKEEVARLKKEGVKIFIALGHSGFTKDLQIAKEVEDIDLVIGGHTNTFLWNGTTPDIEKPEGPYPTLVKQRSGRLVPAVQAYAYTKYLGKLHLVFSSAGEIVSFNGNPILLNSSVPQDPDVLSMVQHYRGEVTKISEVEVGYTSVILDGHSCRLRECNMGNLIADAIVHKYASAYKGNGWTDSPIAVIQGGGIRSSVAHINLPSAVTKGDLITVMPFEANTVKVSVNGTIIWKMLEHSVEKYNPTRAPGQFLQVSGIRVEYDFQRPAGRRVAKVFVRCGFCLIPMYSALNKTETYNVLMPSFLSTGGDGFAMLDGRPSFPLNYDELQATTEFINKTSPVYPATEGRIMIHNENKLKSLGNHEFDEAVDGLIPFIKNISSPVVAANLNLENVPELKELTNLYNSVTLARNGVKIGIIGYLLPSTKYLAPRNKVEYEDEIPAIRREVEKLKRQGVEILMALGHSGYLTDVEIAKQVDELDVVIGGHSNTFLWNGDSTEKPETPEGPYPVVVNQASGRKVLVVQAYAYTKYMGKLHLTFDSEGEITHYHGLPILLDNSIPQDPDLLNVINAYSDDVNRLSNKIVGKSTVLLNGNCRVRECNMGNFITDTILNYTKLHFEPRDVNIAICQGGRIRVSLVAAQKPFNLTKGDWLSVLPFSDTLTVVTMNGSVLRMALEHSVARWRLIDQVGEFLQFSGMEVVFDILKPPGARIVRASAVCSDCGNLGLSDIKDDYTYKVVMPSFLAEGGDGFSIFIGLPQEQLLYKELTCIYDYLEKYRVISPGLNGRLTILNEDKAIGMLKRAMPSYSTAIHSKNVPYIAIALTCSTIFYQILLGHFL